MTTNDIGKEDEKAEEQEPEDSDVKDKPEEEPEDSDVKDKPEEEPEQPED
jgi:hypothetical protein